MMKHGLLMPALLCWAATAAFAVQGSPGAPQALSLEEMEAVEGGDLYLAVDRDHQMMTVTQVTPGQYSGSQSYSVKVTTSVVQNKEVTSQLVKGDMTNDDRKVATTATSKTGENLYQLMVQYPSGTYRLSSQPTTSPLVQGPVIRTSASQRVPVVNASGTLVGSINDYGYNIHYTDPRTATNTWGCIGVQSVDGMTRLVQTLAADTATYADPAQAKQTVSVTSYTNAVVPPPSAFTSSGLKGASTTSSSSSSSSSTSAPQNKVAPVTRVVKMKEL